MVPCRPESGPSAGGAHILWPWSIKVTAEGAVIDKAGFTLYWDEGRAHGA